jgi:glycosyltransferase involved in cell wall biosynthesis
MVTNSSMMSQPPDYSVVIPIYNEKDNIRPLVDGIIHAMVSVSKSYEIVLVDDGSVDGSSDILEELCLKHHNIRYLMFDQNCGQTAAFDAGFKAAKGNVVITMDADLQYDPKDIPLLLAKIGEYDTVCGYRAKRDDTWARRISSKVANYVRNKLSGESIRDVGCSLKAFKKECLENLKLYEGMHRFLPTLIKMEGYKVTEVPVNHFPRRYGISKYGIRNRLFKSFRDLLAVRWMKNRKLNYRVSKSFCHNDKTGDLGKN